MKVHCPSCVASVELGEKVSPDEIQQCPECGMLIPRDEIYAGLDQEAARPSSSWFHFNAWQAGAIVIALVLGAGFFINRMSEMIEEGSKVDAAKPRIEEDFGEILRALEAFERDRGGYPSSAEGLEYLARMRSISSRTHYLYEVPIDPWGNPYGYRYPPKKNKKLPDVFSYGPDEKKGTRDDVYFLNRR